LAVLFIYPVCRLIAPAYTTKLIVAFTAITLSILAIETTLLITGHKKTYLERQTGIYISMYKCPHKGRYHVWRTNPHYITKTEFKYIRPTNNEGLPDSNWTTTQYSGIKKIMAIGDSFTEGDGAAYDSTYPAFLKQNLLSNGQNVYMMNAAVCGSDPFYNYIIFKEQLLKYKPDIVIQMLSSTDILTDYMTRGGLERFIGDSVSYRKPPKLETLYALSYTSRLFFNAAGYNEFLLNQNEINALKNEADTAFAKLFEYYANLCRQNNIKLVLVLRPDNNEVTDNRYVYNFDKILTSINAKTDITFIDLLPQYKQYIANKHTKPQMYYWPIDGHHNATGYKMLADAVYPVVNQLLADSIR
jgi:lysophospholipase L1-like esterase